jgi:hypothetical protein
MVLQLVCMLYALCTCLAPFAQRRVCSVAALHACSMYAAYARHATCTDTAIVTLERCLRGVRILQFTLPPYIRLMYLRSTYRNVYTDLIRECSSLQVKA